MTPVSVVVPAYQRIPQTLQTIRLLLASNGAGSEIDIEVIVADSTQGDILRLALMDTFGRRVLYTRPVRVGIASNKNKGARIASHTILIFCDSDIEVEKDTLLRTVASLKNNPSAAAVGGMVFWRGGDRNGQPDRPRPEDRMHVVGNTTYIEAIYSRYIGTYKGVFVSLGGYDEEVFNMRGEGSDLSIRYWRFGYPLSFDSSIVVHHVHDASDSAAIRVSHPEWGIAKDLLLLAYKYQMLEGEYQNFAKTVAANFHALGVRGCYELLQGIHANLGHIREAIPALDEFASSDRSKYSFPFLEVFTDKRLLQECLAGAEELLRPVRAVVFPA